VSVNPWGVKKVKRSIKSSVKVQGGKNVFLIGEGAERVR